MKSPRVLLKATAVGCSALLIAGFVSYRAGAFDSLLRGAEPAPTPTAEPELTAAPADAPVPVTKVDNPAVFYGSKSIILAPAGGPPGGSTTSPPRPVIMPGSKSAGILTPDLDIPIRKPELKTESPAPPGAPK